MMSHWFIWNEKNSFADFGLWVRELPKHVRAKERYREIKIPGRAGSLILTEGEDIYDPYATELKVSCKNTIDIDKAVSWLRGTGELVLSTDLSKVIHARIANEVIFERDEKNKLFIGVVPLYCQPFKTRRNPSQDAVTITSSGTMYNPGDVASKPIIRTNATGNVTITISGQSMAFSHLPGHVVIDCDAQLIIAQAQAYDSTKYYYVNDYAIANNNLYRFTSEGIGSTTTWEQVDDWDGNLYNYIWQGAFTGEYFKIPKGNNTVTVSNGGTITIEPQWRWV